MHIKNVNKCTAKGALFNRKGIIPVFVMTLTILIMLISIGYAALNQNLNISGEAFLRAKDNIRISRVELSDTKDEGYETYSPEYSKRTTKMYTTLPKDTSSVTYTVKVTNSTGIKYKVDSIEVDNTNSNVSCTPSIEVNSILEDGVTEFTVIANYENKVSQDTNLNVCDIKYEFSPLDATTPTLTAQLVKDNGNTKVIKIVAEDDIEGSGLSQENVYKYYLSTSNTILTGGEWKDYTNNVEFEIEGDLEVKHLWVYPIKDKAGNISDNKTNTTEAYLIKSYTFIDNSPTLYNVIAKEALTNGVAKLYTGEHNDTYNGSGTRKIFHFYGADNSKGTEVLTKNNIIFAGFCWQMIRTTDTGGVKLIYSGYPSNINGQKQCIDSGIEQQIGSLAYNTNSDSPAYGGYMYNTVYQYKRKVSSTDVYKYAKSFTYSNGTYTLSSDATDISITNSTDIEKLNNAHYTCFNTTGKCETIYYVYNTWESYDIEIFYIELNNGKSASDALNEMLYADNVNKTNSAIKNIIDSWYKNNMTSYTKYLEDTVFCNDRSILDYGGWNPNGGNVANYLKFKNFDTITDLYCTNVTDRFSLENEKAKLTYPIGIMSAPEMNLLGSDSARKIDSYYWLSSFVDFSISYSDSGYSNAMSYIISSTGSADSFNVNKSGGIRPSVSLAPGTKYSKGTGSTTDPYIVDLASPTITYETLTDGEREKIVKIIASDDSELASDNKYKYYLSTSDAMLSGGEWKDYTPGELVTLTGENETKYLWVYPIMDNAQNINDGKTDINTPYVLATLTFKDKFYLYNILQKEYASGSGLAKLYSGQHSDTYNETGAENIYYFYGADSTASQNIANKNNLLFAGFCWQIIRTTDTKGTKLIYNGVPKETDGKKMCTNSDTEQIIGTSKYNEDSYQKPMYAGYMYGTDVEDFATNANNSIIKNYIENWYAANMTPYTKYLEDTVFCNDRNVIRTKRSEIWWTNTRQTTAVTNLYCTNVTDRFSVSNSSAKLTYPVGMISLPEINILGNTTLTKTSDYWTISPDYYWEDSSSVLIRYVSKTYVLQDGKDPSSETGVRPVISISSSVEYSSGTGSATDPYIVDLESPSITVDTLKDERNQKTVKITVSDDSNLSIDNQYKYYLSTSNTILAGGEWKDYTPGEIITLTGENETRYLWIYPVKDIAGNINDGKNDINTPYVVASYKFTSLPPVINVTTTNVSNTQKNVVINITTQGSTLASDNKYQYCLSTLSTSVSGCTWKDYTNGTSFTVTGTNGYYYLWIYAISDNAGNVGDNRNKNEAYMKESIILYSYSRDFNYINGESTFNVTVPGYYKLEVWGAQGGSASSSYVGGYGGYSSGTYKASSGETLYLNVGGAGSTTANGIVAGGYNGGGNASGITRYTIVYNVGSGGGATSIAKVSGTLRNLTASNLPNILIVAGGGGGSNTDSGTISYSTNGGSGGGINGTNGRAYESSIAVGGSQTSAGTAGGFGYGGSATGGIYTGGGGGLYGGGLNAHDNAGAAGGSGYIGNSLLTNKVMYCYNCATSAEQSTKTVSTTCTSSQAASNCSKQGNGYARITFIST